MGNMTSAVPHVIRELGDVILALNQNMVKRDASRMFTLIEHHVLSLLHRLVYRLPKAFYDAHSFSDTSTLGIVQSGATLSNVTALWIARNLCFAGDAYFSGVEKEGISAALDHYGFERAVLIAPELAHYSISKAASVLGLGEHGVISVPVNNKGRMSIQSLREALLECRGRNWRVIAIVAIAGSTDCGSIDPLGEISAIAREFNIHLHVDAAWGMPLLFSRKLRHLLKGINGADSVTLDGHKQLYLPIGTGVLLLRDPSAANVIEKQTRYMLREGSGDLGKCSFEGSRPGMALFLHAGLHVIGPSGYGSLLEESIRLANVMADKLEQHERFQLLMRPETNIVLYRYVPIKFNAAAKNGTLTEEQNAEINRLNVAIQKVQTDGGHTYVSLTTVEFLKPHNCPIVALRAVILNPLTSERDVDFVLRDQLQIAVRLTAMRVSLGATHRNDRVHAHRRTA
jgi:putative pyridoxal-dependent aspartate 1-decarboxylase